jgi:hypothetical protein
MTFCAVNRSVLRELVSSGPAPKGNGQAAFFGPCELRRLRPFPRKLTLPERRSSVPLREEIFARRARRDRIRRRIERFLQLEVPAVRVSPVRERSLSLAARYPFCYRRQGCGAQLGQKALHAGLHDDHFLVRRPEKSFGDGLGCLS